VGDQAGDQSVVSLSVSFRWSLPSVFITQISKSPSWSEEKAIKSSVSSVSAELDIGAVVGGGSVVGTRVAAGGMVFAGVAGMSVEG